MKTTRQLPYDHRRVQLFGRLLRHHRKLFGAKCSRWMGLTQELAGGAAPPDSGITDGLKCYATCASCQNRLTYQVNAPRENTWPTADPGCISVPHSSCRACMCVRLTNIAATPTGHRFAPVHPMATPCLPEPSHADHLPQKSFRTLPNRRCTVTVHSSGLPIACPCSGASPACACRTAALQAQSEQASCISGPCMPHMCAAQAAMHGNPHRR